jgi:EAL domain-containing protein (putative c-di-GMP-specific phosphodiesterase class I)
VAGDLGQETIAEYVGDEESFIALARCGVGYAQGYHLGAPEPLS